MTTETVRYLSRTEVAHLMGVEPDSLSRAGLPEPDATIGAVRGWAPAAILAWLETRPGQGARTDLKRPAARGSGQ